MNKVKRHTLLIALGGNALQRGNEKGRAEEQIFHIQETSIRCVDILEKGYSLIITHGNGPQVGNILLQQEYCEEKIPSMPLDICGAKSQGMIGYMIQQQLYNQMRKKKRKEFVASLCTQVLVNPEDPAFQKPTKPIGRFYTQKQAQELHDSKGWQLLEQQGKGFRRVVPSPIPIDIVEKDIIKNLIDERIVVIACGGGGIPVIRDKNNNLVGVEAVIDKDRTAAILGHKVNAQTLMIVTDVEQVALHFGTSGQKNLDCITIKEAQDYLKRGEFGVGSMGPKVEAACTFIQSGGERAFITSLEKMHNALDGLSGTKTEIIK